MPALAARILLWLGLAAVVLVPAADELAVPTVPWLELHAVTRTPTASTTAGRRKERFIGGSCQSIGLGCPAGLLSTAGPVKERNRRAVRRSSTTP